MAPERTAARSDTGGEAKTWVPAFAGMHGVGAADDGVTDVVNERTVFRVVRAESREAAARLFEGHPHCATYPCDAV